MTESPRSFLLSTLALAVFAAPFLCGTATADSRQPAPVEAAHQAMLGRGAPPSRVIDLSSRLRVVAAAAQAEGKEDVPLFAALSRAGTAEDPSYEGHDLSLDLVTNHYGRLRIEGASVLLVPADDGASCRFEISGAPFGQGSRLEVSGSVEWGTGPFGGDRLDVTYRLGDAPVEALRAFLPDRIDPSFRGDLELHGKASGVVGETTTEAAPATPLRGSLEADLDWEILGRTGPVHLTTGFAIDDRVVRVLDGKVRWEGLEVGLVGWVNPLPGSPFSLTASFAEVDTHAVALDWDVPEPWRPVSALSGKITFKSKTKKKKDEKGTLAYDVSAPSIVVPGLGGQSIRLKQARLKGNLLAINAEIAISVRAEDIRVGDLGLETLPVGIRWWRNKLTFSTNNNSLWGGEADGSALYELATHPEFQASGRVKNSKAARMAEALVPDLDLDVEGAGSLAFHFTLDADQKPHVGAQASLQLGRVGGLDLFAFVFDALAKLEPALASPDVAALAPVPRRGVGTSVDKLFVELDQRPDGFALGGLFLRADDFQVDGDGHFSHTTGLDLEASVSIPAAVASKLVAAAPWLSSLQSSDSAIYVPVVIRGPASSPTPELTPAYLELLARAKRGESVTPPGVHEVEHVGPDNLATIPGAPVLDPFW